MTEQGLIVNGIRLHSAYNPQKEAERFVQSLECSFIPKAVLITEPALSYTEPYLRQRFSGTPILAVRYDKNFAKYDKVFDHVFYLEEAQSLAEQLFSYLGEEGLSQTLFLSWKPSEQAYPQKHESAWKNIKEALLKSRDVLGTRTYFAKRWAKNACRFALFSQTTSIPQKTKGPLVVCASGPSLSSSLPYLKKFRSKMTLIAVSSALQPLVHEGIMPDLVISTDGGYWAKAHLACIERMNLTVPLALPAEAACYTQTLTSKTIVPLAYGDGISQSILEECKIASLSAERNGTVSGTACKLALELTDGPVYACGLDLASSKGKVHAEPNENENRDSIKDRRLCPKETRLTPSHFENGSLTLYRTWFKNTSFGERLHRLSEKIYTDSLGQVDSLNWETFEKLHTRDVPKLNFTTHKNSLTKEERKAMLQTIIRKHKDDPAWIKDAFPALAIQKERSVEHTDDTSLKKAMEDFEHSLLSALGATE